MRTMLKECRAGPAGLLSAVPLVRSGAVSRVLRDRCGFSLGCLPMGPVLPRTLLFTALLLGASLPSALQADPLDGASLGWEERLEIRGGVSSPAAASPSL